MKMQEDVVVEDASENTETTDEFENQDQNEAELSEETPVWLFESTITNMAAFENTISNLRVEDLESATDAAKADGDPAWRVLERRREERELKAMLEDDLLVDTIQ